MKAENPHLVVDLTVPTVYRIYYNPWGIVDFEYCQKFDYATKEDAVREVELMLNRDVPGKWQPVSFLGWERKPEYRNYGSANLYARMRFVQEQEDIERSAQLN